MPSHSPRRLAIQTLEHRKLMAGDFIGPCQAATQTEQRSVLASQDRIALESSSVRNGNGNVLEVSFTAQSVLESSRGEVSLVLERRSRDLSSDLVIRVAGGDADRLTLPKTLTIPAGERRVTVRIAPIDDSLSQRDTELTFTFTAQGYQATGATIHLVDDEPPKFQNPALRFDVNGDGDHSALDALMVINALARYGGSSELDPLGDEFPREYPDVNGDYRLTALDALAVINDLKNA